MDGGCLSISSRLDTLSDGVQAPRIKANIFLVSKINRNIREASWVYNDIQKRASNNNSDA